MHRRHDAGTKKKLWSTPSTAIDIALQFANLDVNDVVYDVGCGDGRVLIQMAALSVALPHDKSDHHDEQSSSEHHMIDNKESQLSSTSFTNATNHHHCKHFVGIEISSDRANEARQNIQNAYESNQIPKHVSIQIICGNALDATLIDYTKATVIFLYLVPRGLRLMKDIVWPDEKNLLHEGEGDEGEEEEDCSRRGVQSQDIEAKLASMNEQTQSKDETSIQSSTKAITLIKQRRPRRIITYMSPFENTKHIRKEYCKVEHQEGAEWPVYLYHCKL